MGLCGPLLPPAWDGGRPRSIVLRNLINAILYITRAGCAWRLLPHLFPKWRTVYGYLGRWKKDGIWPQIHDTLRARVRQKWESTNIQQQVLSTVKALKQPR